MMCDNSTEPSYKEQSETDVAKGHYNCQSLLSKRRLTETKVVAVKL